MVNNILNLLTDALQQRAMEKPPVNFWLRDDDAIEPSETLDRLLCLTERFRVPLTLAVIPAHTGQALAQRLSSTKHVSVAVHGWSHTNYASEHEKKQELGDHRPQCEVLDELERGLNKLAGFHHQRFVPLLVPPWNRVSLDIVKHISAVGFKVLSTFGDESFPDVVSINTQVDIIDWKGTRGGRPLLDIESEIIAQLSVNQSSIGILTHHLVHDEVAWQFLEQLFEVTSKHEGVRWLPVTELLCT